MRPIKIRFNPVAGCLLVAAIVGVMSYQQWQQMQANRPDYDNPNPPPRTQLPPEPGQSETWDVVSVTDGDTIVVQQGMHREKVRLCGIDAPEVAHGNKPGQPLGDQAKAYLQQLIDQAGGTVMLVKTDRDRYGRLVAEVFVRPKEEKAEIFVRPKDEKFVQEELLVAGMAYIYPKYVGSCPNHDPMGRAEAIGQEKKVGIWAGSYQRPWDFRRQMQ